MTVPLDIAPAVQDALAAGEPVVALESSLIAHGLPAPHNLETARAVEAVVRDAGAVPATIALIGGRIRVGCDDAALARLAGDADIAKASRRDLAPLAATGRDGATTVAATMISAARAGIAVFATGGIGGVHRGAEASFDISADLVELGRTPVAVVCSGIKAILDLPKTVEMLETQGVPVIGFGTDRLAGFYVRDSGLACGARVDTPDEAAAVIEAQRALDLGGLVIANPIAENHAIPADQMEMWLAQALAEADAAGTRGKAITPHLLSRIAALSEGCTLAANIALIKDNARLAAEIAGALSRRREGKRA